jgi:hypothetical protein
MDGQIESLLRAHLRASRQLLSLHKPEYTDEAAEPVLDDNVRIVRALRKLESKETMSEGDRISIREHIDASRRLLKLKAREFHFAYFDPDDGEGGSPIYARISPLPPSLLGYDAKALPFDD